jgi:hypothetical protein
MDGGCSRYTQLTLRNANPRREVNRQLESRMREIRLSGSEGGVGRKPYSYPYQKAHFNSLMNNPG